MRRSEVYLYFNLAQDAVVFHLMGPPEETRHIIMKDHQAVVSPGWSIHAGVGTRAYSFCWGMGGENQDLSLIHIWCARGSARSRLQKPQATKHWQLSWWPVSIR